MSANAGGGPRTARAATLLERARAVRGFMPDDEGLALYEAARRAGESSAGGGSTSGAVLVEIGAWCGKSTLYLGAAAEETGAVLFSVDHHRGSEEQQPGWAHHDPDLVDPSSDRIDTLPHWRRTISAAGLEGVVVGVVGDSPTVAACWATPIDLCFIDGGHGEAPAWADYLGWAPHVAPGGLLAIHDVFPDPADGGRPPYELWCHATASGAWTPAGECGSLRILQRASPASPASPASRAASAAPEATGAPAGGAAQPAPT